MSGVFLLLPAPIGKLWVPILGDICFRQRILSAGQHIEHRRNEDTCKRCAFASPSIAYKHAFQFRVFTQERTTPSGSRPYSGLVADQFRALQPWMHFQCLGQQLRLALFLGYIIRKKPRIGRANAVQCISQRNHKSFLFMDGGRNRLMRATNSQQFTLCQLKRQKTKRPLLRCPVTLAQNNPPKPKTTPLPICALAMNRLPGKGIADQPAFPLIACSQAFAKCPDIHPACTGGKSRSQRFELPTQPIRSQCFTRLAPMLRGLFICRMIIHGHCMHKRKLNAHFHLPPKGFNP